MCLGEITVFILKYFYLKLHPDVHSTYTGTKKLPTLRIQTGHAHLCVIIFTIALKLTFLKKLFTKVNALVDQSCTITVGKHSLWFIYADKRRRSMQTDRE